MSVGFTTLLNRLPIYFEKEIFLTAFGWVLKEFNNWNKGLEIKDRVLTIKKRDIWKASTTRPYTKEEFNDFIKGLTISRRYEINKEKGYGISGSIFVTQEIDEDNIKIEIPSLFIPYLFYKHDILILDKAKKNEPLTVKELDYWDNELKHKKQQILLLEEADLNGINGKYAKRLYMLLKQFENTGYFVMGIEEFRDVLEVPSSYTLGRINDKILKLAQAELEKKGIFEFVKESKGKGRRKIDKIEMSFKSLNPQIVGKKEVS
ncbi:MAG: replication initiation protein, partial [Cetobacterium sp.]